MSVYCDASVLAAILNREPGAQAAEQLLLEADATLLVSDLARGEVVSGISRLTRMRILEPTGASDRLEVFAHWLSASAEVIPTNPADVRLAVEFVARYDLGLRMPDAIHVAAARNRGSRLATLDRVMAEAARTLDVEVIG